MKKNLISILCGIVILIIGVSLFLTTYLQGATGYHSNFVHIGLDPYHDHDFGIYMDDDFDDTETVVEDETIESSFTIGTGSTTELDLTDMDSFHELVLNAECADVKISVAENGPGKIAIEKLVDFSYSVDDGTLYINAYRTDDLVDSVNGQKIEITLPKNTKLDYLYAYLNLGSFSCKNVTATSADITTDLGEITLKDMRGDTFDVSSHCGEVDIEDIHCDSLNATTDLGNLEADGWIRDANLTVSMGNCELEGDIGNFTINNDMGNTEVKLTGNPSDYYIDISNDMGKIQVDSFVTNDDSYQYGNEDARYFGTVYSSMGNVEIEFDYEPG